MRENKIFTPITNHVGTWHLVETESITQAKQNTGKWHRIFCAHDATISFAELSLSVLFLSQLKLILFSKDVQSDARRRGSTE